MTILLSRYVVVRKKLYLELINLKAIFGRYLEFTLYGNEISEITKMEIDKSGFDFTWE